MGQYSLVIGILTTLLETLNVYARCICPQFGLLKALQGSGLLPFCSIQPKNFPKKGPKKKYCISEGVSLPRKNFKEFEQNVNFDHNS